MGFFATMIDGYKIWGAEIKMGWQKHGAQILTGGGTGLMLIASALLAKKGSSDDVQKAIAEANAAIDEIIMEKLPEKTENNEPISPAEVKKITRKKKFRLAKAKAKKIWSVGKHFWKEALVEAVGAGCVMTGQHMNTIDKAKLGAGIAAVSAEFAAYRANVISDQGEAKDLEYLTTKREKGVKSVKTEDGTIIEKYDPETGDVTLRADPSAFKFWCSPETCPGVYMDNLDMTIANLECIESNLTRRGRMTGHLYLNDMRREFGGLVPDRMDHPLGGIFGLIFDRNKPDGCKQIDLGWRKDLDFTEGRKVGVWIIFPCEKEPIAGKVNQKLLSVENAN